MNHANVTSSTTFGRRARLAAVVVAVLAVIATLFAPLPGMPSAWAGPGSRVAGVAWADTDRDGVRDAGEPVRAGIAVVLVDENGEPIPGFSTTTATNGTYAFTNVPDGTYMVRFDAPGEFRFPAAAGPDNDAVRLGDPVGGDPERGTTAAITVTGASLHPDIDAGLQPIATLQVTELPGEGCEGRLMTDGTEPWDATDGDGNDSADDNCLVRTRDTVSQTFGVQLTGLVSDDATVNNVIVDLVIHAEDGAVLELVPSSTSAVGLPASCLLAGQGGASPGSTIVRDQPSPGDITIHCNVGRMTSNLTDIQVSYRHTGETAIPSYAHISASARAAGGDAGVSNEVDGPDVYVTGYAEWELRKTYYNSGNSHGGPDYTEIDWGSGLEPGYRVQYQFTIEDMMGEQGGSALDWSTVTFTDVMKDADGNPLFPGARIIDCRWFNLSDSPAERSPWSLNCPEGEEQGTDGWQLSITPRVPSAANGWNDRLGRMAMTVFIPYDEMHAIEGPNGEISFDNAAQDTDDWKLPGGGTAENHGDGEEPGFDGTGDNLASITGTALEPQWDLSKTLRSQPSFTSRTIDVDGDGDLEVVEGYLFDYRLTVRDLRGPDNIGPWIDGPVTFTDQFLDQYTADPDDLLGSAFLLACTAESFGTPLTPAIDPGDLTCETGAQPVDSPNYRENGWDFSFEPNQHGFDYRQAQIIAQMFLPLSVLPADPCATPDMRLELRNQAISTDHWTVGGEPNNGGSYEPNGWRTEAEFDSGLADTTSNNVDTRSIRPGSGECGTLTGGKAFVSTETGGWYPADPFAFRTTYPGNTINSAVHLTLSNRRVDVLNPVMCDVFDVSTMYLRDTTPGLRADSFPDDPNQPGTQPLYDLVATVDAQGNPTDWRGFDPADFVIEYAIGPNEVDTQAGAFDTAANLWPADTSSILNAVADCETTPGPSSWRTDPTSFGADWQDRVNMIRVRPVDPNLMVRGQVRLVLEPHLQLRSVYNGGPHDGQMMPDFIRITNEGGWSSDRFTVGNDPEDQVDTWATMERQRAFTAVRIEVGKTVTPAQYFPGDQVIWNLRFRAFMLPEEPMEFTGLRLVDTLPEGMQLDTECTQNLLPAGVTVSANLATRQMTFFLPDVTTTGATSQWIAHETAAGALRIRICAILSDVAQTGDTYTNRVQGFANEAEDSNIAQSTISVIGPGKLGIAKGVDKPYVASGEDYTWNLDWVNTSTTTSYAAPDIIDVLPWNGDSQPGSGSQRDGYGSSFTGVAHLTGPLAQPTYTRGGTGVGDEVPGTWYYTTAASDALSHDARNAANANPQAPGGLWLTAAEVDDFAEVTGIRFVSGTSIAPQTGARALLPAVSVTDDLDVWYVNRGSIFTTTAPDSLLLSNQPVVQIPGFAIGDLVWIDHDNDGRYTAGIDTPVADVDIEVIDEAGEVVGSVTTDANGRWSVAAIPAGTYRARIPAHEFQDGGTLEPYLVQSLGSSAAEDENEGTSNSNTDTPAPAVTGLTSSPITLAYVYEGTGDARRLVGANGPVNDDVANLAPPRVAADFTNFTIDLALVPSPRVDIEKHTNTVDADEPTGPRITVGDTVEWTYIVTNTGSTDLFDIIVTDDIVASQDIDCGDGSNIVAGPLAIGGSVTCVATGVATLGQYANLGSVVARGPLALDENGQPLPPEEQDPPVTDEDWSHYFGIEPAVGIEKATNGQDADTPTGPLVTVGGAVRWTYVVTNTGTVPLTNVTVTDDLVAASEIDCSGTGSNVIPGPVAAGASFTCVANGTATLGQYANLGSVVGTGPETTDADGNPVVGEQVTDDDPSHYLGVQPAVDIEKSTNGQDADTPTGPLIAAGGAVRWTYVVTNTGTVPLTDVTVTDDLVAASEIDCDGTGSNAIPGPLPVGGTFTCVAEGDAIAGQYANLGTVTGTGPVTTDVNGDPIVGQQVSDTDPSHYLGVAPVIDIEKHTNGQDADTPTGPYVTLGGAVQWTYIVTNTGNVPLTDVTVTDDLVAAAGIDCDGTGSNVIPGPLAPTASFTCVATGIATAGQYANLGSVTGVGPTTTDVNGGPVPGVTVDDEDPSHYFGTAPAVDIEKHTNGEDADDPTGPYVPVGEAVTWTYIVTNTGNVPLTNVTVTDDVIAGSEIDCGGTGSNVVPGPLAVGASFTCEATGVATAGQYTNLGTVVASGPQPTGPDGQPLPDPPTVTDADRSHYFGAMIALDLVKDAVDAHNVTGAGDVVTYEFTLTNTGNMTVTDARIVDEMPGLSEIVYEWTGEPGVLAPGQSVEAWATYTVTAADVQAGEVRNAAFAIAIPDPPEGTGPWPPVASPEVEEVIELPQPDLAGTGGQISALTWMFGLGLLLTGAALFAIARRRRLHDAR